VADQNQYFKSYRIKHLIDFYQSTYATFSIEKFHEYNKKMKLKLDKKVYQLSKGMQMRLALMLNLAIQPEILVLDEPTSGLDAIAKKEVLDMIIQEVEAREMTVLISSHHLSELEKICDEMSIISHGKVTYQSTVDELKQQVKKVQVVFEEKVPVELYQWPDILDVTHIGSVYYLVTKAYHQGFEDRLRDCGVKLLEVIPLSLEEIFIYTNRE
ncbi:MAG: ATP-binding cassette domain-containing protein, partial [Cellulosilyticaceae bacterium]